ncbi:MAG: hypothetical protein IPK08_03395 [Bacteroidetes bacterium]|nr:hypothetical protein [Bacteroidota bacterium]
MKRSTLIAIAIFIACNVNGQTNTDSTQVRIEMVQLNLNKYYNQTRTGTGIFAFGALLGTATLIGLDRQQGEYRLRNSLYGVAGAAALTGLLINMEAIRFVREASEISIGPGGAKIKF